MDEQRRSEMVNRQLDELARLLTGICLGIETIGELEKLNVILELADHDLFRLTGRIPRQFQEFVSIN
jgi:hypothetical protein